MATALGTDTLTTISREFVMPDFIDNVYLNSPMFFRLSKSGRISLGGGLQIEQPIMTSRLLTGGAYSGYDVLDVAPSDTMRSAAWDWKQYYTNVTIDGLTELRVDTPAAIADYVATFFDQARMDLTAILSLDLWANIPGMTSPATGYTNNRKGLDGLAHAINAGGNSGAESYGGIDRSVSGNSYFRGKIDSSTTTLTLSALNSFFGECVLGGYSPTVIASNRFNYNLYANKMQASNLTYNLPVQDSITDQAKLQAGFTNLYFNNTPWICDDYANGTNSSLSAGPTYFLNEEFIKLIVNEKRNFDMGDFRQAVNQDAMVSLIRWAGNVVVNNPRSCGVMTALAS
jgi:hypothetical protein